MPDMLLGMVDAMLLDSTTPEQIAEIGHMATEGAMPIEPDDDGTPPIPEATAWAKEAVLAVILDSMNRRDDEEDSPLIEKEPQPTPAASPLRHSRKKAKYGDLALSPLLTPTEIIEAGQPEKEHPIVIHQPPIIINPPQQKESPAMLDMAKAMMKIAEASTARPPIINLPQPQDSPGMTKLAAAVADSNKQVANAVSQMAKAASKPQKPPTVINKITTPEVKVDVQPANITVKAAKAPDVKVDVHMPEQRKIKGFERDKDGNMTKPIYEDPPPQSKKLGK